MSYSSSVVNPEPKEGWSLPFDVVSGIMAISRRSTVSALMKTCHTLYTEGPKHLLRDGVQLDSTFEVMRFATFMLTGDPSRFAYLQTLVLLIQRFVYPGAEVDLARLLSHPSLALETLVLRPADVILGRDTVPVLRQTIGRLTTIKQLVVLGVNDYSASLIKSLPCELESITISISGNRGVRDVLRTLTPFSHTLRTLVIKSPPYVPTLTSLDTSLRSFHFPHVQMLGILYHDSIPDDLASPAFAQAFPAITHLQLIPTDPPTTRRRTGRPTRFSWELRFFDFSQHSQGRRSEHSDGTPPSLSSLAECSGGLLSVCALRLDCTLSTLRLWQDVQADELDILRTVLEDTRPGHLCLSIELVAAEPLFTTLRTQVVPPARIDMKILVPEESMTQFRSVLEALFRPPLPMGLVELNLLFDIPHVAQPAEKSEISDTLSAFTHWASTAAPSLVLACRLWEEAPDHGEWQWPDLGQTDDTHHDHGEENE